jgi:hypothetical protein
VLYVSQAGPLGLRVRYSPDGLVVGRLTEDTPVIVLDGPIATDPDGQAWYRVFSEADQLEGWVVGDYLAPSIGP